MEPISNTVNADDSGIIAIYLRWSTLLLNKGKYINNLKLTDSMGESYIVPVEINITNAIIPENKALRVTN